MNPSNVRNVSVLELREGMILAKPVYTNKQTLIMPAEKEVDKNAINILTWYASREEIKSVIPVESYAA